MAKIYVGGTYFDIDPSSYKYPHDDIVYRINGRRYKFVNCHWEAGVLRGYNTRRKKWFDLFEQCAQMDGYGPIAATVIEGKY